MEQKIEQEFEIELREFSVSLETQQKGVFKNKNKFEVLKEVWGYDTFRSVQSDIIDNILNDEDVLALLPTGGGKSILFQLPALIKEGTCIVVSPLLALQEDQCTALKEMGIRAELMNSTQGVREKRRVKALLDAGEVDILFAAPETLVNDKTIKYLKESINISFLAFDEAHCISQYSDFRPKYYQVGKLRDAFECPVIAVTATANNQVVEDIKSVLNFGKNEYKFNEYKLDLDRPSIFYHTLAKAKAPLPQLFNILNERDPEETGIIYCTTRKEVDAISYELYKKRYSSVAYHAGLSKKKRKEALEKWLSGEAKIAICTIAFGMGIDKKDVRYVIHYNMPSTIEGYIQEIGRNARDGLPSDAYLLYSPSDVNKIKWIIQQSTTSKEALDKKLFKLAKMNQLAKSDTCIRKQLLNYFDQDYDKPNCGSCSNCVSSIKI